MTPRRARPPRRLPPRLAPPLLAAALLAAALLAGGCRDAGTPRSVVEQAVALAPEVERATGLRFTAPPRVEVRTREQVHALVERGLDSAARRELAGQALAYVRLGALPDTFDLPAFTARVLGDGVAGYYDPGSRTLYVTQGADSAATAVTLRHELVHALQHQARPIDSLVRRPGQADAALAARAGLEGQATWAQVGGGVDLASRVPGGWERVRDLIRENGTRDPRLADGPLVVRERLLFPYLSGAELARAVALAGHPDSVLRRLPASSEQVLHTAAYLGRAPGSAPLAVTLPPLAGGPVVAENTFGEFDTRLALFGVTNDLAQAARAAQGWGGDRWAVVRTGAGDALAWLTVWDGPADAAEFYEAMGEFVAERYPGARAEPAPAAPAAPAAPRGAGTPAAGAGGRAFTVQERGRVREVRLRSGEVSGRPAVWYVDAPAGGSAAALGAADLARAAAQPAPPRP